MLSSRQQHKNILEISPSPNLKTQPEEHQKIQDSSVTMFHRIKITPQPPKVQQPLSQNEESRKPLPWWLMFLNMVAILAACFQNGYIIYAPLDHTSQIGFVFGSVMIFNLIVCLYTSCYLTQSKWQFFNLYILIDNMLLVFIAASIGFVSFNQFRSNNEWYFSLVTIAFPLDFFLLVGNFRILMVKGEWSKWRIILYKFTLLICCVVFFQIGVYFITVDYSYTGGLNIVFDGQVKELMLLNVFGTFSLIIEMYSKMTDLDHTGELQATYELKAFNDNELANNLIQYSQLLEARNEAEKRGLLHTDK